MKIASKIQNVKVSLLNGMKITVPEKLLGGLALGAILMTAVALPSGTAQASPLTEPPVTGMRVDIEDEGGTGRMFEPWELGQGTNPYASQSDASQVGVLAAPILIVEPLVDISNLGGGITDFEEAYTSEVNMVSDLGGGITDFEEAYTSKVNVVSDLGGGITDFEEAYTSKVNVVSDLGGGITDFEEAYTSKVNVVSDLGGGITDFEEAYTSEVNVVSNLGGGITDFEEAYTSEVSLLHPENEQANLFPEVEL